MAGLTNQVNVQHSDPGAPLALDAWSYDMDDCDNKVRVLKGARLVLVDACFRAIQIS